MLDNNADFYKRVIRELLSGNILTLTSRILVVCGGETDLKVFEALGFKNVTLSNLSTLSGQQKTVGALLFDGSRQDAECLSYPEKSFDFVVVHSGLHHLHCPQKGLNEMYRVALKGIIGFEPARNVYTSLGVMLGVGQEYEIAAVYYNKFLRGGVADSIIPNYVYRFSKGDIIRAVQAYAPVAKHDFRFWYATRLPCFFDGLKKSRLSLLARLLAPLLLGAGRMFPFLANNMAFFVAKPVLPKALFPWLEMDGKSLVARREYIEAMYK